MRKHKHAGLQAEVLPSADLNPEALTALMAHPPRHQHKGVEEQVAILRSEIGRLKKRVRELEDQQAAHTHRPGQPPQRNGVHIDQAGQYFMRRPDGWHHMFIAAKTSSPRGRAWRLREDKRPDS